jgi:hypothetical protein
MYYSALYICTEVHIFYLRQFNLFFILDMSYNDKALEYQMKSIETGGSSSSGGGSSSSGGGAGTGWGVPGTPSPVGGSSWQQPQTPQRRRHSGHSHNSSSLHLRISLLLHLLNTELEAAEATSSQEQGQAGTREVLGGEEEQE